MQLFHPRAIAKFVDNSGEIPKAHFAILSIWAENLSKGIYDSETQSDGEFIQQILIGVLGYKGSSKGTAWTLGKNQPIGNGNVDVALGEYTSNSEPRILAPFELKGAKTRNLDAIMPGRNKSPAQQAWEYATDVQGCKWVLVSNYRKIRLYAFSHGRQFYEEFDLQNPPEPPSYFKLVTILRADNLLGQATSLLLQASDNLEEELTTDFYRMFSSARVSLTKAIISNNNIDAATAVESAQTILDRILFIAFAEDRGLLPDAIIRGAYEEKNKFIPSPVWSNFLALFEAIDKGNQQLNIPGYNGGLFADNKAVSDLTIPDSACELFKAIGGYDFSTDISVNIIGRVFEQSISDIDELKTAATIGNDAIETCSRRREDGIFYTPTNITSLMVGEALSLWLDKKRKECGIDDLPDLSESDYNSIKILRAGRNKGQVIYNKNISLHVDAWHRFREILKNIKVIDPACGSGAFLTSAFDALLKEGNNVNSILQNLHGGQQQLFRWDRHLLQNNLFGVDINSESIELTKLSLWLKTASRHEKLTYIDDQIVCGNSLVSDAEVAEKKAFDWRVAFGADGIVDIFDIVLCNPPYVDSEAMTRLQPREREWIARHFQVASGNWDLYIPFIELGFNLLNEGGIAAFITPDKWLAKDFGIAAREMLYGHIFELLHAGRHVFDDANVDAAITLFSKGPQQSLNVRTIEEYNSASLSSFEVHGLEAKAELGQLFSKNYCKLNLISQRSTGRLRDISEAENACATSDTYTLKPLIENFESKHAFRSVSDFKVVNTGTIARYASLWGVKTMTYLKEKYLYPAVNRAKFFTNLGNTYNRRAASPKVIVKGLTLLDAMVDINAEFVPGKSTLVLCHDDSDVIYSLAGIINSNIASFYVKEKYASASYNGGVNFTPAMLNELPIPDGVDLRFVGDLASRASQSMCEMLVVDEKVLSLVRTTVSSVHLRGPLIKYWGMDGATFLRSLKSHGLHLSLSAQLEWADFLEQCKEERIESATLLLSIQSELDSYLKGLY